MEPLDSFTSLSTLRSTHQELLKRRSKNGREYEFLNEIEIFVKRGSATGCILGERSERWQAQNMLDFWVNELYQARRQAPDAKLVEYDPNRAPELPDGLCPYQGLEVFSTAKHAYFFGRDALIKRMTDQLKQHRFLAIIGASGSGKSSIAQAGLLPQLQAGALHNSQNWRYYSPIIPGADPQASLVQTIMPTSSEWDAAREQAIAHAYVDPSYLAELIDNGGDTPAVLLIDQFEEIFTLCQKETQRSAFINTLLHLIQMPLAGHIVIVTMRTDVESHLVQIPALQSAYEQSQVRMTAMKVNELRDAIEKPAELVGLKFEEGLSEELANEILGKQAALLLLQFTLLKLWENREHNRVTWTAYRDLGGGRQALANSADAFYDGLTAEEKVTTRFILLGIIRPTVEREITPGRVLRQALYQIDTSPNEIDNTLEQLEQVGLIRLIPGITPVDDQVGLAHESVARMWPRLVGWIEESRVIQRRRLRLATTAEQWDTLGRDEGLLLHGLLLEEASQYGDLNPLENAFVRTSNAAADQERLEKEAVQQRELDQARALAEAERQRAEESSRSARRLAYLTIALAFVFTLAVAAAFWAARNGEIARQNEANALDNQAIADQLRVTAEASAATAVAAQDAAIADANLRATAEVDARSQQDAAEQSAIEAEQSATAADEARATAVASAAEADDARDIAEAQSRLATARELAASAIDQLRSDPQLGLLLAIEAVNKTLPVDGAVAAEAEDALYRALQASQSQLTLSGHTDWINDIAFSPDGNRVATAGYDTNIKLWDTITGQELMTLEDHSRFVNSVTFSPDGQRLASASDDGFIIVWDAETGERQGVLSGENGTIRALAFSPDNNYLATANGDATVRIWDTRTRRSQHLLFGHLGALQDIVYNSDGSQLASAGGDGRIIIWDAESGRPISSIEPDPDKEPVVINGIAFSPNGQWIISALNDGTAEVWDLEKGERLYTLFGHASFVFDAAFSPDGEFMATASGDGTAKLWQAATGQALSTLSGHSGGVAAVDIGPDGRIATASRDGTAVIWNSEAGLDVMVLSGHEEPVQTVAFSPDGTLVATGGGKTAKVWDAASGAVLQTLIGHNAPVRGVAFSPDGLQMAAAGEDFTARIWDLETGQMQNPIFIHDTVVYWVTFNGDGSQIVTTDANGVIRLWDVSTGIEITRFVHDSPITHAVFSPDQQWLATADNDGNAIIWDINSGEKLLILTGHEGPVRQVTFNREGNLLATASGDGTAKVWNLDTGSPLRTFSGHAGPVTSVAFGPDGSRLATASLDRTAKLWNTESGQVLRTLLGHTSGVNSIAFSPDGARLATASSDGTAQINDLAPVGELFDRALGHITRPLSVEECQQYLRGEACLTAEE